MEKEYLGDSVYVQFDGYQLVLTTENGYGASNTICLDSTVFQALLAYEQRLKESIKNDQTNNNRT